jgi:D-alanyl-D-alanine carboxypeptidase/D-alanyl-D-alanine-endopeptidase (penicillin-binding protein 4)
MLASMGLLRHLAGPRFSAAALAALLLLGAVRPAPAEVGTSDLAAAIARRIDRANVPAERLGVAILTRGARPGIVFLRGHAEPLVPASTAKILTAAAALDLLGPGHMFTTTVTGRGTLGPGGTLDGDLVVHGSGDPNVSGRFHDGDPLAVLRRMAAAVHAAGIRRVTGALVLDDGPFDREWVHPTWDVRDLDRWYGAPVSGLAFNDGCVDLVVRGGAAAGPEAALEARSSAGPWRLENRVRTVATGDPAVGALWLGNGTLRVQGTIAAGREYAFSHPVREPLAWFAGAFLLALRDAGVTVEGGGRAAESAADRLPGRLRLAQHGSDLPRTLAVMNQRSHNFYASLLFKAAGVAATGSGSWAGGERAIAEMLRRRGLQDEGRTRVVDGSGLSRENRTTAATLARVLVSFDQDLLRGPLLEESLAAPGGDGTLRRRLTTGDLDRRLRAKTGTLTGVHGLAGYLDGRDGHPGYAFAILVNSPRGGRPLIEEIVAEMARR